MVHGPFWYRLHLMYSGAGDCFCSRFTAKCAACSVPFQRSDLVMRARELIFHVNCFRCAVCERRLAAGDQFALTTGDRLCCRADLDSDVTSAGSYDVTPAATSIATDDDVTTSTTGGVRPFNNNNENETKTAVNGVSGESLTKSSHIVESKLYRTVVTRNIFVIR